MAVSSKMAVDDERRFEASKHCVMVGPYSVEHLFQEKDLPVNTQPNYIGVLIRLQV